ncbi:MAG: endonuclease/exonuclease/phosphatase family protein, partial [Planctomycetota bacterium]
MSSSPARHLLRCVALVVAVHLSGGCVRSHQPPPADHTPTPATIDLRVMTFNIRYGTADDGDNRWSNRRELVPAVIEAHEPDVVGLQEALHFQLQELLAALPQFGSVG